MVKARKGKMGKEVQGQKKLERVQREPGKKGEMYISLDFYRSFSFFGFWQ